MSALVPNPNEFEDHKKALWRAKSKAFQFKKGQSGNPHGLTKFYRETRQLAREAGPAVMQEMINLALTAQDERTRAVCGFGVLDRAGIRPQEHAEMIEEIKAEQKKPEFNPAHYSLAELNKIEEALKIISARQKELVAGETNVSDARRETYPPSRLSRGSV
jgi:hypothetical protein